MKRFATTTVLLIGLVITACSSTSTSTSSPSSNMLTGTVHTRNGYFGELIGMSAGDACGYDRQSQYSFLEAGQQIIVKDSKGETVALGSFTKGIGQPLQTTKGERIWCFMEFTVNNVPDSNFYSLVLSNGQEIAVSKEDIENAKWNISLAID